jgi:hypothetical protein
MMDEEDELEEVIDVTQRDDNITYSHASYTLVKRPPHQILSVENLTQKFGAIDFLSAFSAFLRCNLPGTTITPSFRDCFDAYKQIVISLSSNRYLSERVLMDRVRTAPSVNASGRALAKAAHFDCVRCGGLTFIQI